MLPIVHAFAVAKPYWKSRLHHGWHVLDAGVLPTSWGTAGALKKLTTLELSQNHLSGRQRWAWRQSRPCCLYSAVSSSKHYMLKYPEVYP